jgi:hypothetical protein
MPIQDTDLLLIEDTSGASKKIEASKLKANLAANTYNNYKLLVNKPDYSSGFVYAQNMQASVAPTDYMLVERAGVSYKVNGQQIIDYFPSVPAGAAGPIDDAVDTTISGAWVPSADYPTGHVITAAAYGNGTFVAYTSGGGRGFFLSPDAETWTKVTSPYSVNPVKMIFADNKFVAIATSGEAIYSPDGTNWTQCTGLAPYQYRGITYGNGLFVTVHNNINERPYYSTDGIAWTRATTNNSGDMYGVAYGDGKFVAVGLSGHVMVSDDGDVWQRLDSLPSANWWCVTYGDGKFVAGASNGNIAYSTDAGASWTVQSSLSSSSQWKDIIYEAGTFLAVSQNKTPNAAYSTNGIDWYDANAPQYASVIAYGNNRFVVFNERTYPNSYYSLTGTGIESFSSTLTLASDTNLDTFTIGDAINMVDSDGNVVNYGPQTSALTSVTETDYTNTIVATSFTNLSDQSFSYGSLSNVFNRAYDSRGFTSNGYGIAPNVSHNSANAYRWHLYTFPSPITVRESFMMDIYDGNYVEGQASLGFIDSEGNETLTQLAVEDRIITNFSGDRYVIPNLAPGTVITAVKYQIDPLGPKASKRCIDLVYALIHDGLVLTDGIRKLNFASPNPELSLFKEGSIVNGINTTINTSYDWSTGWRINNTGIGNLTNSFDGDVNTWGMLMDSTNVGASKPITANWDVKESPYTNHRQSQLYVRPGAELEFKIKTNGLTGEINIYKITNEYSTSTNLLATYDAKPARTETIIYTQPEGYWLLGISGSRGSSTSGRATIELAYVKIDGVMLVDGTNRASAEVQKVDLADNCMYVNNGDFSPPNTVSAEGLSGTGNFNGYSGNIVNVANSNQEWVADPNHFIKSASTRTGLAILRTKAIAQAQAWSANTNYESEQLVKHNGRYWLALSASYANSPDETDTSDWFDLGLES